MDNNDPNKSFKTKWEEVDQHCPNCNQVTHRATGLTRQNVKRLFIGKPTMYDWIFLFIIVMTLFMASQYNSDISQCRYTATHFTELCTKYMTPTQHTATDTIYQEINMSLFKANTTNVK